MSLLATVGSTAPFIGLFGTAWGIMTSFIGIAQMQTTNLAVVAPGIAEALLATICEDRAKEYGQRVSRSGWRLVAPMHIAETLGILRSAAA